MVTTTASLPSTTNLILQIRKPSGISNRQYRIDDLTLREYVPSLTATINNQIFPETPVNQQSETRLLTVTGSDLTDNIVIAAPAGYLVRSANTTTTYAQSVTLAPNTNGNASAQFDLIFAPTLTTAPGPYPYPVTRNINVASTGATTVSVTVSGSATAPQPILTANPISLAFGTQTVGTSSAGQTFQLTGQDLTGNVTVTPSAGFEIRQSGGTFSPNQLIIAPSSGSLNVLIEVRFVPGTTGDITGNIIATGNGSSRATVAVSGSGTPAPVMPVISASPNALDFQTITSSGSTQNQTFTASATNLSGPLTLTPSNANIQIRNATVIGSNFASAPLNINPNASGNITNQTIEVRLVRTVSQGSFSGSVALTSTGATQVDVSINANNPTGAISDISLTNSILREFSTSPTIPSSIQSYTVSADNLLQDLTITAPQFFQISLTNNLSAPGGFNSLGTVTGNSIVLPRITGSSTPSQNNDVELTTIYVRYYPPAAQTNRGQVVTNSSAPAETQYVTVNGSSEPEVNVRGTFTEVLNQVKGTQSAAQSLVIVGARLNSSVVLRVPQDPEPPTTASPLNPSRTPQFQISRVADFSDIGTTNNPTGYSLTLVPDGNDSLARITLYARYAPTRVGSSLADLLFRTPDLGGNVEFDRRPNARLQGRSIDVEPTRQSGGTLTRSSDGRSVTIVFKQEDGSTFPGNPEAAGFGENRLIIASLNSTLTAGSFPVDATPYDPNNNEYGGNNPNSRINGNYVVFASSAATATITGLDPNTTYYFFGFEYNNDQVGGAENYKTPNLPIGIQLPLPVQLVDFTAQLRKRKVNLQWVTASEKNNRGFEVQRSQNGKQFSTVLFKEGHGTTSSRSTYEAIDEQPLPGVSYYRLKQIDNDGKFVYSPVVTVKSQNVTEVTAYPNPTSGKLTISLPQEQVSAAVNIRITDLSGRIVKTLSLPATNEVDLSELKAGTYLITVVTEHEQTTRRVVKN
ncbi:T9SS type A sorting domain-containing protein [Hymenobacter volaticus]|uniref:T9SS type A sorting domain-containing protein n=1 Tax=Hymenobacter volaticus TaxID=2932254 RepID=A0ABY4G207_9BACT|nr:T9SS type A sorting domain-containing protein [Hymenobacter volaticus]UOQ64900.1 T9SS type A sorting domain-containing protein [Hymenobacter volaticus]